VPFVQNPSKSTRGERVCPVKQIVPESIETTIDRSRFDRESLFVDFSEATRARI
jgi:hypothetical protein